MKIFKIISNRIDSRIKKICDSLSPVQKMCLSVTLFTIFFLAALYIMVMAAYQVGKSDGKLIQIELSSLISEIRVDSVITLSPIFILASLLGISILNL